MTGIKAIIIGGGLAGSLLACGLTNNHVDVVVYERDARDSKREGYQIRLGDPATKGINACLTDSQKAPILEKFGQSVGAASTAPTIYNSRFEAVLDLTELPAYSRTSAINRVVLRNLLVAPVDEQKRIHFDKTFSHYEIVSDDAGNEKVKVHFRDGTSDLGDVMIGADGSGSKINKQLGANNIVDIDTHWSFLSKGRLPMSRTKELPQQLLKGPALAFARDCTMFFSLYLPQEKDRQQKSAGEIIHYNQEEASFYWAFSMPKQTDKFKSVEEIPDKRKFILDFVSDWAPEYHTMLSIGAEDEDTAGIIATQFRASHKLSKRWRDQAEHHGELASSPGHPRVWLLGDAVHPMQPNRGMGANQAMYDTAEMLPELLSLDKIAKAGYCPSTAQVAAACQRYEDSMIERAFGWVTKSGGTSIKLINLDGMIGTIIFIVGAIVLPIARFFYIFVLRKDPEKAKQV